MPCAAEALSLAEYQTWLGEPAESQYFSISSHLFSPSLFLSPQIRLKRLFLSGLFWVECLYSEIFFFSPRMLGKNVPCSPTGCCAPTLYKSSSPAAEAAVNEDAISKAHVSSAEEAVELGRTVQTEKIHTVLEDI